MAEQAVTLIRSVGGLIFDATFEEQHESDLEVTDNPVESGVTVSDHAFAKPKRITLQAGVSDTPMRARPGDTFAGAVSRSRAAYEALVQLQAKAEPFDVQTGLKLYKNMVCTSVRAGQDKDTANSFVFTAVLREVQIVNTQAVTYPPRQRGAAAQQASKRREGGEKQGQEAKPAQRRSIAKVLADTGSTYKGKGQ